MSALQYTLVIALFSIPSLFLHRRRVLSFAARRAPAAQLPGAEQSRSAHIEDDHWPPAQSPTHRRRPGARRHLASERARATRGTRAAGAAAIPTAPPPSSFSPTALLAPAPAPAPPVLRASSAAWQNAASACRGADAKDDRRREEVGEHRTRGDEHVERESEEVVHRRLPRVGTGRAVRRDARAGRRPRRPASTTRAEEHRETTAA